MICPILIWPDRWLNLEAVPVNDFGAGLQRLVVDLFDTLRSAKGIGLAAPQIGVPQRVVVLEVPGHEPVAMVNPVVSCLEQFRKGSEGCLSVPGETGEVERAQKCHVTYQDVDCTKRTMNCVGLLAVAVQHEVDHLNGVVYAELLPRAKREPIRKRMLALQRIQPWPHPPLPLSDWSGPSLEDLGFPKKNDKARK